jgi:hypothetical protein
MPFGLLLFQNGNCDMTNDRLTAIDWKPVTLTGNMAEYLAKSKAAYAEARKFRELFEAEALEGLNIPAGQICLFAYRGDPVAAIVKDDGKGKKRKADKPAKESLQEYLARTATA